MAPANFLRLLPIFSLALLNISFGTLPANAIAVERGHMARGINHAHVNVAKKRGNSPGQCKPRPGVPASSTYDNLVAISSSVSPSQSQPSPTPTPTSSGSSSNGKLTLMWSNNEQNSMCNFANGHTK